MPFGGTARSTAKLIFRQVQLVGIQLRVVLQHAPRQRIVLFTETHEAAEAHHRIGNLARALLDHDAFDRSDLFTVGPTDRRSLDLVARDEIMRLADFAALTGRLHRFSPSMWWLYGNVRLKKGVPKPRCPIRFPPEPPAPPGVDGHSRHPEEQAMTVRLKPVGEQVVVITGASSGIGLTTARMFAERGVRGLVLVSRNGEALDDIARELEGRGVRAIAAPADTANREDLERVARVTLETFGGFDTWINNAAVAVYGKLEEVPIEDQRQLFDVNYWGVVNGSLIAARHLRQRGGAIINTGSVLSERAMIFQSQYSASKHAVKAFTDGLRMELERDGAPISVTLIKPSAIDTPYVEHARNYLDSPSLATPPPTYDPHLVAKAMVFAAAHPKRELTVGLGGWIIGAMGTVAPRLTDYAMELTGYATQTTDQPERRQRRDNLYRPREDGDEYSTLAGEPRKTSLFLTAQMYPMTTALVLAGLGFAMAQFFMPRSRDKGARRRAVPSRRYETVTRRVGNGHDQRQPGPGYFPREDRPAHPVQPRH